LGACWSVQFEVSFEIYFKFTNIVQHSRTSARTALYSGINDSNDSKNFVESLKSNLHVSLKWRKFMCVIEGESKVLWKGKKPLSSILILIQWFVAWAKACFNIGSIMWCWYWYIRNELSKISIWSCYIL
jgi:hypothetical protein